MAYNFVRASSQYLSAASAPVTSPPFTLSCLFYIRDLSAARTLMALDNASGTNFFVMLISGSSTSLRLNANTSVANTIIADTDFNLNEWNNVCGVFTSATSRELFLNGVSVGTSTVSAAPSVSLLKIGTRTSGGVVANFMQDDMAEVGIWNAALTQPEIASLAKGMACDKIRPQSLVFYAPLARDLIDVRGGLAITNNNTATVANHPRIYQ
jgi:hypothetical protein